MTSSINSALLRLTKRAEASARETLIETFVDVGPLFALLSGPDHQVLFGRRGTGKTHALAYLADSRERAGDAVAIIDLRNVGSSSGLYADFTVPLAERATRLLVDVLGAIHEELYGFFVEHAELLDLAVAGPALDALANAITEVRVTGGVEQEVRSEAARTEKDTLGARLALRTAGPSVDVLVGAERGDEFRDSRLTRRSGEEQLYVNFGATAAAFRGLTDVLNGRRLWVLLDEWSSIPIALQPYLGDLIRRSLFPIPNLTVKIAAIEQRSVFRQPGSAADYVGIELGADAAADVNLDDFMVFDNDAERAKDFFQALIARHVTAILREIEPDSPLIDAVPAEIMKAVFTEKRAVEEFVRASEGVPRDAINILALAAQRSLDEKTSVQHVRGAARNWYQRDKEKAASANERAQALLHWIIDEVIGERRARAFLLRSGINDSLVDALYDSRVLHILKRGISTHDQPGVRYDVYKLDYGCYVDLITTARAPQGLLPSDSDGEAGARFVDVPPDDYRSIRRAILELDAFHETPEPASLAAPTGDLRAVVAEPEGSREG